MKTIFRIMALSILIFPTTKEFAVGGESPPGDRFWDSAGMVVVSGRLEFLYADSCEGEWQLTKAKLPDSKVALKFTPMKGEKGLLKWSDQKGRIAEIDIHKAKAPIDAQGEIEICSQGATMAVSEDSYSIKELQQDARLLPGYYAVRVIFHSGDGLGDSSDWIVIRIR
jgi:hypothetical protein